MIPNIIRGSFCLVLLSLFFASCGTPKKQLNQAQTSTSLTIENDTMHFKLNNPLKAPIRYYITSTDSIFNTKLKPYHQIVVKPLSDSLVNIVADTIQAKSVILNTGLGDPLREVNPVTLDLPLTKNKQYSIIQAYDGAYSHNTPYSKFAIDFGLKVGDTVCAAANGVVVGIIKDYKKGGANKKWGSFANYITLYHPESGIYTQYVHLKHNGVLVQLGDEVKSGQPIGLSGKTGWTDVPHLHFNVLIAVNGGLVSIPVKFNGGYNGPALKRGDVVVRKD